MRLLAPNPLNRHHPLARGLAAWYLSIPGLRGGQYWYDLCGLNHGTLANGTTWSRFQRPGAFGPALQFDGVNDKVSIPSIARTADYTLACWVYLPSNIITNYATILSQGATRGFYLRTASTTTFYLALNDPTETLSSTYAADTWQHLLVTATGGTATYYINGQADSHHPAVSGTTTFTHMGDDGAGGGPDALKGFLDDVRIYNNRFFTAAEAFNLYQNSRLGCPSLLRRFTHRLFVPPSVLPGSLLYTFTVQATDANGLTGTQTYNLTVNGLAKFLFSIRATDANGYLGQEAYEMIVRTP